MKNTPTPIRVQGSSSWKTAGAHLLFGLVLAAITLLLSWQVVPEVWQGELLDTDNYMRLLRVQGMVEPGGWFDNGVDRSNAPFGETLHWTRPLDLLLLAGAAALRPFIGFPSALFLAGMVVSPVLLLLICYAAGWAAVPLAGRNYRYYAMIAVLAQLAVMAYALPGRPDHHPLLLLCFILTFGAFLRTLQSPPPGTAPYLAGALLGLGVWTSTEFLVPAFFVLSTGVLAWVVRGGDYDQRGSQLTGAFAVSSGLALLLERPVAQFSVIELDRFSLVHVVAAGLAFGYWVLVRWTGPRASSWKSRLGLGGAVGGAVLGLLWLLFPRFFLGPTADIDSRLMDLWFRNVGDNQPMLSSFSLVGVGRALALAGPALVCLPFLLHRSLREWGRGRALPWVFLTLSFAGFLAMALYQLRFAAYVEILIAVVTAAILSRLLPRIDESTGPRVRTLVRAGASGGLIVGFVFLGGGLMGVGGALDTAPEDSAQPGGHLCRISEISSVLTDPDRLGGEEHTVLSHVDYGPELLYRTPHRVLATPYHRNATGILGAYDILSSTNVEDAMGLARARGVDLILLCPARSSLYTRPSRDPGQSRRLYDRLVEGEPVPGIRPVPLGPGEGRGFLLFELR